MKQKLKPLLVVFGALVMSLGQLHTATAQNNPETLTNIPPEDLKRGLVLHFNFDAPPDDGKVRDLSGQHNDGQAVNVQWLADGHQGGGAQFGLTNSYITVSDNTSLNPPQYTLAAWIKTSHQDGIWRRIIDKGYGDYDLTMAEDMPRGKYLRGRVGFEAGSNWVSCSTIVTDGKWHHCAGVFDAQTLQFFLDGHSRDKVFRKGGFAAFHYDVTIGASLHPISPVFDQMGASLNGAIDDVMIYNRPLSAPEVRALFESQGGVWVDLPPPAKPAPATPATSPCRRPFETA